MNILTDAENHIVDELRLAFYEVVPAELRTFCSLPVVRLLDLRISSRVEQVGHPSALTHH